MLQLKHSATILLLLGSHLRQDGSQEFPDAELSILLYKDDRSKRTMSLCLKQSISSSPGGAYFKFSHLFSHGDVLYLTPDLKYPKLGVLLRG